MRAGRIRADRNVPPLHQVGAATPDALERSGGAGLGSLRAGCGLRAWAEVAVPTERARQRVPPTGRTGRETTIACRAALREDRSAHRFTASQVIPRNLRRNILW